MLSNERFALACRAWYEEQGLVVDKTNGQFAHSPLTRKECDTGYYLLWGHHQHQGLLQSRDLDKCCFFPADALKWLLECDCFPESYFELWDIYEKYSSILGKEAAQKTVDLRVGAHGRTPEKRTEDGKKGGYKAHEKKDKDGKSLLGKKIGAIINSARDEFGRSILGLKNAERLNAKKDANGKSVAGTLGGPKGAKTTNSQIWESTVDGFRSNAGGVASHNLAKGWDPNARVKIS